MQAALAAVCKVEGEERTPPWWDGELYLLAYLKVRGHAHTHTCTQATRPHEHTHTRTQVPSDILAVGRHSPLVEYVQGRAAARWEGEGESAEWKRQWRAALDARWRCLFTDRAGDAGYWLTVFGNAPAGGSSGSYQVPLEYWWDY